MCLGLIVIFCFKHKTAYELRISDWSSGVCSSDLAGVLLDRRHAEARLGQDEGAVAAAGAGVDHPVVEPTAVSAQLLGREAVARDVVVADALERSEERRVGKEWVRPCRSRWSPSH